MKRLNGFSFFFLLTLTYFFHVDGAISDFSLAPCNMESSCFAGIEGGVDFIYWRPCIDDLDYAAEVTNLNVGDSVSSFTQKVGYKHLAPDWDLGYRFWLCLNDIWCDWRLATSFTFINAEDQSSITASTGNVAISPLQHVGLTNPQVTDRDGNGGFHKVKGSIDLDYCTWDLLLSKMVCGNDCYGIIPFFGFEALWLDQKIKTKSTLNFSGSGAGFGDGFASTEWKSDFSAYGIKFGVDYVYQVLDCLQLFTHVSTTVAVGDHDDAENKQKLTLNTPEEGPQAIQVFKVKERDSCRFVNGYSVQLGMLYETAICGFETAVQVAWDLVKWHNVPKPRRYPSGGDDAVDAYNSAISTGVSKATLGFYGMSLGLSVGF